MKVLCVNDKGNWFSLRDAIYAGRIYEVSREDSRHYYLANSSGFGYWKNRFEIVSGNVPSGWRYCKCGTLTTNKELCCDCK
jgi:hypothetical protein